MLRPREEKKKSVKRYIRQKAIVVAALILWGFASVNLCINSWNQLTAKENVVSAFRDVVYSDLSASITANGYMGEMPLTESAKYIILEEIAERIGIDRYDLTSDEQGCTILHQASVNGDVAAKIITVQEEAQGEMISQNQYLCITIELNHTIQSADHYREIIENIMEDYQIDTNVTVYLSGSVQGKMTFEECRDLKNTLINEIGGTVRIEKYIDDIYTVYAYDKSIESYITMGKDKININVTMTYDEVNDRTQIYLATPINNQDY